MMDSNGQGTATAGTRLFSVGQIVLATFLGAPIAGFLLLARNYQRLGNKAYARVSLLWGVVATAVLLTVTWYLPENFPNAALPVAYCIAMRVVVNYLQGATIETHLATGGMKGSWGRVIVVGLICLVLISGVIFGTVLLSNSG